MSDMPQAIALEDVKAVIILTACDIIQKLNQLGDEAGAYALVTLVKCIEQMPIEASATLTNAQLMADTRVKALVEALEFYAPCVIKGISFRGGDDGGKRATAALAKIKEPANDRKRI